MLRPTLTRSLLGLTLASTTMLLGCDEESSTEGFLEGPRMQLGPDAPTIVQTVKVCPNGTFIDAVDAADIAVEVDAMLGSGDASQLTVRASVGPSLTRQSQTMVTSGGGAIDIELSAFPGIGLREMCSQGVELTFTGAADITLDWRMFARIVSGSEDLSEASLNFQVLE